MQARPVPAEPGPAGERVSVTLPPLDLATVSRLVLEQNAKIAVAHSRVQESWAEKQAADQHCLGTAKQLEAEGKIWQQQLELSRVTSETLLDATGTYVDLLAARSGESIGLNLEKRYQELLERAQKLAEKERGAQIEVARIQAGLSSQQRAVLESRQQAAAAAAKLAYDLGLDPETKLVLLYDYLMRFQIVDASPSARELIARAQVNGPGVREMEVLINFLNRSIAIASHTNPLLQAVVHSLRGRVGIVQAKLQTTLIAYEELRGKLATGVMEAQQGMLSGLKQIQLAEEAVAHAERAYELSNERSKQLVEGSSFSEVGQSLTQLAFAHSNAINALRSYDRAQIRLWILLGADGILSGSPACGASLPPDNDCPIHHGGPQ